MRNVSIRVKVVFAIVAIMGVCGLASTALVRALYARSSRVASEEALRSAAADYEELERQDVARISALLDVLAANQALRDAFAAKDRDKLQAIAQPIHQVIKGDHGIGHWNFVDTDRRMFLRVHLPTKHSDLIERPALVKAMERREMSVGKELGKSAFALRVGKPVFVGGQLVGYMELGDEIERFLGQMKQQSGNDYAMFIQKKLIDGSEWARTRGTARNNWNDFADVVITNATTPEALVDAAAIAGAATPGRTLEEAVQDGKVFARGVFPVRDSSGNVVGGLVVRHDITALRDALSQGLVAALAFFAALAAAASVIAYLLVDRLIFRRLRAMMSAMEDASMRLAGGDYAVAGAVATGRKDEIGRFESFFGEFLALVANTLRALLERQRQAPRPAAPPAAGPRRA